MRLIKEFAKFQPAQYSPMKLFIKGQQPIYFDAGKTEEKEKLIRSIINKYYPGFTGDSSYNIDEYIVSGELLNKAQKNISILYEIVDIAKQKKYPTNTSDDIINFIRIFGKELFYPPSDMFDRIINRLGGATEKGKKSESESNSLFKRYALSKGISVDLKEPVDYRQDIAGIDAWFEHNGVKYTIQTKTLTSIIETDDSYAIHISGDFTQIKTHYLILLSPNGTSYIFKGKNIEVVSDIDLLNYYLIPKTDLLYKEG